MGFLLRGHARWGPVFTARIRGASVVVVGTLAGVGELFARERGRLEVFNTPLVHDLFGECVFNLTGPEHRLARGVLLRPLSVRSMGSYVAGLGEVAAWAAAGWAGRAVGDLYRAVREVTFAMSARAVLGIRDGEVDDAVLRGLFGAFVLGTGAPGGRLRYGSVRYWAGRRGRAGLVDLFAKRAAVAPGGPGGDVLSALADAFGPQSRAPGELGDHLLALLIAARETTASLITWCLVELARDPALAERAGAEAQEAARVPGLLLERDGLPRLRAVLSEGLRMHSPNIVSLRRAVRPVVLGGFTLPAGCRVAYSPAANHFGEDAFPQPFAFRPGRFVTGDASPADLLAFGGGAHACPGRPLAELMALSLLAAVLSRGRPRLPAGPPARVRYRPAKAPHDPLPFVLEPLWEGQT